jgi:hypothetical protein
MAGKTAKFRIEGGSALCEGAITIAIRIRDSFYIVRHFVHDLAA